MIFRKLGRTGADVGIVGLGAEHLEREPYEVIDGIVGYALDNGVNYIDLFMPSPGVRDNFGRTLKGKRDRVMIAGHLGAAMKDGQYHRTRECGLAREYIDDLLNRLGTDYIDVLMLHYIDEMDDLDNVIGGSGMLELATELKMSGKARFIGMSSHVPSVSLVAVNSGHVDVLMFPVNPAFDMLPDDTDIDSLWKDTPYKQLEEQGSRPVYGRKELFRACEKQGVGIVVMKAYAAGWLFRDNPSSIVMTAPQCLHYALSQPGVSTVAAGCKTLDQMKAALAYLDLSDEQKDYSIALGKSKWNLAGTCMYCNHCLPCASGIDIAAVTRLADSAAGGMSQSIRVKYAALEKNASDCIQCGICMGNCPFGVDVISNMDLAVKVFGMI